MCVCVCVCVCVGWYIFPADENIFYHIHVYKTKVSRNNSHHQIQFNVIHKTQFWGVD